jgi:glycosyltransferase involved in cell wall biosynthesis
MKQNKFINRAFPVGSARRKLAKRLVGKRTVSQTNFNPITYKQWITNLEPALFKIPEQKNVVQPLISIVVPCYNTPVKYIEPLIDSVIQQTYKKWELCLIDGSTNEIASAKIKSLAERDDRIAYIKLEKNFGIAGNTNEGLKRAKGSFVAFLDHDDTISPYALAEVIKVINEHPNSDLIYSDEDKLSDDGKQRMQPFFKPDWSPEMLLGVNYITHFVIVRKTLVDTISGLRKGFEGAQDYDFLLRLTEITDHIKHIPKILYHWRLAEGSTAKNVDEKNYADTAGQRALKDAIMRRGIDAEVVEIPSRPTNYRLKFKLPEKQPKVSIIIPFKDKPDLLKQCIESILSKTTYQNYELILVSNNSTESATHKYLVELKKDNHCKVFVWNHPFNYSKINNYGRRQASGEYIVLLNNDTKVITPEWLDELIGVACQPGIGAVGPVLYYPKETIQHAGIILGMKTMAGHVFRHHHLGDWTDFGMPAWPRNYLAVTGACLAIKASKFDEVGGLDEIFTIAGNDVALGISLFEKGYRNVYWPFAELIHYESISVGSYDNGIQLDYDHSLDYYRPYLNWNDPYFNPNLDLMNEQIGLRSKYE